MKDAAMGEIEQAAAEQLQRVNGGQELHAAVLALLLPTGSQRALRAWQIECAGSERAEQVRDWVGQLSGAARLPWLEVLVSRMRGQPPTSLQTLLESTRRVMRARGIQRPIDRLHWLAMRQRLGEGTGSDKRAAAATELSQLPQGDVIALSMYSAFLARMVPAESAELDDLAVPEPGLSWYANVMAPWNKHAEIPACAPPDTEGLVYSLQTLQSVAWMQRPALVRGWVTAAIQHSRYGRLTDTAADALRLSCSLLDSPMPPELASHYSASQPAIVQ
jgi:hypothetical protein